MRVTQRLDGHLGTANRRIVLALYAVARDFASDGPPRCEWPALPPSLGIDVTVPGPVRSKEGYPPTGRVSTGVTVLLLPDCRAKTWDSSEKVVLESRSESSM